MLQDRKSVRKLREALDQHASPGPKSKRAPPFPRLNARDSERRYEAFIRSVRACNNLPDARRFRSDVASQLKKASTSAGQPDLIYVRRLEIAKEILDKRIAEFIAAEPGSRARSLARNGRRGSAARVDHAKLADILRDPSGLSYFMEFMDRRKKMTAVQFWLVVDGLRNPLEDDPGEDEVSTSDILAWSDADRNDLLQIYRSYLSTPELRIPLEARHAVSTFLESGAEATTAQYYRARKAILKAQTTVLESMQEKEFPEFKKSDLYFKYLTSDEAGDGKGSPAASPSPLSGRSSSRRPSAMLWNSSSVLTDKLSRLRKITASSSDIRSMSPDVDIVPPVRRSLDGLPARARIDERLAADPMSNSIQSLDSDPGSAFSADEPDRDVMQALEVALNDIIEGKQGGVGQSDSFSSGRVPSDFRSAAGKGSDGQDPFSRQHSGFPQRQKQTEKPSIASLGLVNTSSRIGVFKDDDLFSDEEKFIEDEYDDPEDTASEKGQDVTIQEAVPGDLRLDEAIAALNADIDTLVAQDAVVNSLTLKAELTNNATELRILRKSKASLQREIRRKELQRQQYILQEQNNKLYGRATIRIKSVVVGTEEDGREYAICEFAPSRIAGDKVP
jgi:sorting nexin-25